MIKYLLDQSESHDWSIRLGDIDLELAKSKIKNHPRGVGFKFDAFNESQREKEIQNADIVISMLPARHHYVVAETCLRNNTHMVTASYVSDAIKGMDKEARQRGVLMLNEIGVDPGIDHMSAMKVIDEIKEMGGKLTIFESNTGGLVAPEYDNNPWNYKFTWNPRNVVVAGQAGAMFRDRGQTKYIPYHQLFKRTEIISVLDYGEFEVIPNRDSLQYIDVYNLANIRTMFRGTMRRPGFACGWHALVQLGATDDTYIVDNSENITNKAFINSFLPYGHDRTVEEKICDYLGFGIGSDTMQKLKWLGVFSETKMGLKNATPAQILQKILEEKWQLDPEDKDMIVMQHQFVYELDGKKKKITSSMIAKGVDQVHTAMSITVGMPLAIATKLILTDQIKEVGVHVPITKEFYAPVLRELEQYGIKFIDETEDLD